MESMESGENIDSEIQDTGVGDNSGTESEVSWWLDAENPGVGERPEWLPKQFKRVSDLGKSYSELQKKLGQSGSNVPKEYDLGEYSEMFAPDNEIVQKLMSKSKENGLSQKAFSEVLGTTSEYIQSMMTDPGAEMKKLGDDASERIEVLNNWAKSNLSETSARALFESLTTADAVKAVEEIRSKLMTQIPNGSEGEQKGESKSTYEDVRAEMSANYEKYKNDANYRKEIKEKLALVTEKAGFVDKVQK